MPSPRGPSQPRDWTQVSRQILYHPSHQGSPSTVYYLSDLYHQKFKNLEQPMELCLFFTLKYKWGDKLKIYVTKTGSLLSYRNFTSRESALIFSKSQSIRTKIGPSKDIKYPMFIRYIAPSNTSQTTEVIRLSNTHRAAAWSPPPRTNIKDLKYLNYLLAGCQASWQEERRLHGSWIYFCWQN